MERQESNIMKSLHNDLEVPCIMLWKKFEFHNVFSKTKFTGAKRIAPLISLDELDVSDDQCNHCCSVVAEHGHSKNKYDTH